MHYRAFSFDTKRTDTYHYTYIDQSLLWRMETIYPFHPALPDESLQPLEQYRGKVVLICNTASHCGFSKQFEGLEKIYQLYRHRGVEILAFPCNQFAKQDPGDIDSIKKFCQLHYGVSFPIFGKVDVNGKKADPLFVFLKKQARGLFGSTQIKWNFTKFLIKKDGTVYKRYAPMTAPRDIIFDIERLLYEQSYK